MSYASLRACLNDLEQHNHLVRIEQEIDPNLEAAEIQRRVYQAGGPAIEFANVRGCRFPMVSNLFGALDRARFIFRDSLELVRRLIELKIDPSLALRRPFKSLGAARAATYTLPKFVSRGPVLANETSVDQLPPLKSWPDDGGPFITLPQVYTEDPDRPGWRNSNLGMYRVQLSGNRYEANRQVGLHYQIHRGIGVHHTAAMRRGEPLRVCVHVGGPPVMNIAAVMPLPEGLSELIFAGALGRRRVRMIRQGVGPPIFAEADFCLTGFVEPDTLLPEGPFGDHLGYYSLAHDFPVLRVERVYHRNGAIWPFTVVGRPPQEDTTFGQLIHELTGPVIPSVTPGVRAVHAVDAAGVHPLLLAIGSERYTPYAPRTQPQEILTQANAILGQGQMSLAKYLLIVAGDDDPELCVNDIPRFFAHLLRRIDWRRDLHFQTRTTIDTLDYSGGALNAGSKVVMAAAGPPLRDLPDSVDGELGLPPGFRRPIVGLPGVLVVTGPSYAPDERGHDGAVKAFCEAFDARAPVNRFPLVVVADDSEFAARSLNNLLWVTFTRSNPAADIHGVESFIDNKHYGCRGALVIDARIKPHHAPPLVEDPGVTARVDQLAAPGGPLHGMI